MQLDLLLVSLYLEGAIIIFSMSAGSPSTRWLRRKGSSTGRGRCHHPVLSERGRSLRLLPLCSTPDPINQLPPWDPRWAKLSSVPQPTLGKGTSLGVLMGDRRGTAVAGGMPRAGSAAGRARRDWPGHPTREGMVEEPWGDPCHRPGTLWAHGGSLQRHR